MFLQRYPADKAYYIAKELLMTERTYKKDMEVITVVSGSHLLHSTYLFCVNKIYINMSHHLRGKKVTTLHWNVGNIFEW